MRLQSILEIAQGVVEVYQNVLSVSSHLQVSIHMLVIGQSGKYSQRSSKNGSSGVIPVNMEVTKNI